MLYALDPNLVLGKKQCTAFTTKLSDRAHDGQAAPPKSDASSDVVLTSDESVWRVHGGLDLLLRPPTLAIVLRVRPDVINRVDILNLGKRPIIGKHALTFASILRWSF